MALQFDRVRDISDAMQFHAERLTNLFGEIDRALRHNTANAVVWTQATKTFTADATANTGTSNGHGLLNGQKARVTTTGVLPAPLAAGTDYFLVGVNTNTWQFAATLGGAAIDLTTDGTGTHTLEPIPAHINLEANGNLSGRLYTPSEVSNVIGSLDQFRNLLLNQAVSQGDHLGNLNKLARPRG